MAPISTKILIILPLRPEPFNFINNILNFSLQEIMYQTKQMREIVNSVTQLHCCGKLEIFCPSLLNEEIEHIVQFLYNGEIVCADQNIANQTFDNLTKVFGFPFTNWSNTSEPSQVLLIQPPLKIKLETVDNTGKS